MFVYVLKTKEDMGNSNVFTKKLEVWAQRKTLLPHLPLVGLWIQEWKTETIGIMFPGGFLA